MKLAFALALPLGLYAATCGQKPDANDAVAAAPGNHKVVLENDMVRVLEATVPLHTKELPHAHPWPSVFFEQTSGKDEPWKTVNIRWSEGGPSKGFDSADRDRHNLLVEVKHAGCATVANPKLPDTDAIYAHDPNMKVALENAYVRVLSVTIPPGEKEPWHTHTWPAVVIYFRLPTSERFTKDGKSTKRDELKQLQVTYDPNGQPMHSIENKGSFPYQAYRVELKPLQ